MFAGERAWLFSRSTVVSIFAMVPRRSLINAIAFFRDIGKPLLTRPFDLGALPQCRSSVFRLAE